jgi:cobalt/nickel transport system permease protein
VKRISTLAFILVGIAVAVALVIFIAPNANPNPDGLEKVAAEKGFDSEVRDHDLAGGPFADYGVSGVGNRYAGTWISGLLGVAVTFAIGAGIVYVVRRSRRAQSPPPPPTGPPVTA